jgi:hypothetical protein
VVENGGMLPLNDSLTDYKITRIKIKNPGKRHSELKNKTGTKNHVKQ